MKHPRKPNFMNNILDDIYHPEQPVCHIIATNAEKKKQDHFAVYRPQPKTCVDYSISQTDTKLDAGDTKIHIQETKAEYIPGLSEPPPPPPPKKIKYFSGGPPQWEFLDEIWRRKQKVLQKMYRVEFKKRVAARKKKLRQAQMGSHRRVIALVGPAWFQELSPKQMATVDNLKNCILKDLAEGTIINTQENIGDLGLVLRPNHRHIDKALKNCCKCPVEFLLILYQLINPNRVKYSINDRLLLSAVVHLTMKDTLRELHIRIPSPPPPPKLRKKVPKKKKKVNYPSPYLVPYTFKREPPKFSGIYCNKHVQRPQSPYFCYLEGLKKSKEQAAQSRDNKNVVLEVVDEEIEEEMLLAQALYEELVDFRPVPVLLKPSKYIPCDNFRNRLPEPEELEEEEEEEEEVTEDFVYIYDDTPCYAADEQTCCDAQTEIDEEIEGACTCPPKSTCGCASQNEATDRRTSCCEEEKSTDSPCVRYEEAVRRSCHEELTPCLQNEESTRIKSCHEDNTRQDPSCGCRENSRKLCFDEINASYKSHCRSACTSRKNDQDKECEMTQYQHVCPYYRKLLVENSYDCSPKETKKKRCECKEKAKEFIETPLCQCERCVEERKKKITTYVISGLKETESNEMVPIIDRVILEKPCECLKNYEKKVEEYEKEKEESAKRPCDCRKEAKKLIEEPLCPCEKCQEDRRRKAMKYIIGGVKETESDQKIPIIEGVTTGKPCRCLKEYENRIDKYEAFQKSRKLVCSMKEQNHKFIIGGVVNTRQGPVYVISGMRPPLDCICAKKARAEEEEKRREAMMPHVPPGRVMYGICGVKETPQGNVYILNSALPIEDCQCMGVYQQFREEHAACIKLYEDYLALMKDEYNEFMNEMLPPSRISSRIGSVFDEEEADEGEKNEKSESETTELEKGVEETAEAWVQENIESNGEPELTEDVKMQRTCECCRRVCWMSYIYPVCCYCGYVQKVECEECICGIKEIPCIDCTCGPEEVEEEEIEEEEQKLKRFFIFKKILCNYRWQMELIKKALETMANDGYPLAKLPDCYKLPHFKLWMQMRCGQFWTQEDRYKYVLKSKSLWRHCDVCSVRTMPFPTLAVSKSEARLLNWSKADYCRKLVSDTLETFYRKIKQITVDFGREFFPSTFSYEFPFITWRDCYFAYTPSKEEDVLARFVWQRYDFKNFADMNRHCG